jgi:hypothetical protein
MRFCCICIFSIVAKTGVSVTSRTPPVGSLTAGLRDLMGGRDRFAEAAATAELPSAAMRALAGQHLVSHAGTSDQ